MNIPDDLPDDDIGLRADEIVCPDCHLAFYYRLTECPSCAAGLTI